MPIKPDDLLLQETLNKCSNTLFNAYLTQLATSPICPYPHQLNSYPCITLPYIALSQSTLAILLRILYSLQIPLMFMIHVTLDIRTLSICMPSLLYPEVGTAVLSQHLTLSSIPHTIEYVTADTLWQPTFVNSVTSSSFYLTSSPTNWLNPIVSNLSGCCYTLLCLASPLPFSNCNYLLTQLQALYNTLYVYQDLNYSETYNTTHSNSNVGFNSYTKATTQADGKDLSDSCSHTTLSTHKDLQKIYISANEHLKSELMPECTISKTDTKNHSTLCKDSNTLQDTCKNDTTDTCSNGTTDTLSIHYKNTVNQVPKLLESCKALLDCYNLGTPMFEFATYFLGNTPAITLNGGSILIHNLSTLPPTHLPYALNTWTPSSPEFTTVLDYLSHGQHPRFTTCTCDDPRTPALPCCLDTLATFLSFSQKEAT